MAEKKCVGCGTGETMTMVKMSSADWQRNEQRHERREKRLIISLVISVLLMFSSNACWIFAWCQYDYESTNEETIYKQNGEGTNIIGDSNEVNNGAGIDDSETETNTP